MDARELIDLMDWRRRISTLYAEIRADDDPERAWKQWRSVRDELFRGHPQSPLPVDKRDRFDGVPYFEYDPRYRVHGDVEAAASERLAIPSSDGSTFELVRFGRVSFDLLGKHSTLDLFWLESYAGGVFLSFRDATSGGSTYGAGRYLIDSAKGADLGMTQGRLLLDFNFAYNPSCSYDARWVCPLAPPANRLDIAVEAGERIA